LAELQQQPTPPQSISQGQRMGAASDSTVSSMHGTFGASRPPSNNGLGGNQTTQYTAGASAVSSGDSMGASSVLQRMLQKATRQ
jgi:hypothetical protein